MMTSSFFSLLLTLLPFLFFVIISLKRNIPYEIQGISKMTCIILLFLMATLMGLSPVEQGADKEYYILEFLGVTQERDNEIGWILYNKIIRMIVGDNFVLFFIITAFIYAYSYYFVAKKLFPREVMGYFVVLAVGSMGYVAYGNNTIRSGLAISFLFYLLCMPSRIWLRVLMLFFAIMTHKAMIIPILAFIGGYIIKRKQIAELFWLLCLFFSIVNVDLGILFEKIGFMDQRVDEYINGVDVEEEARFRFDFLIYSIVPLYISNIWMRRYKYENDFFLLFYKAYLYANSVWLLAIRIPHGDRLAYLSWFMIPILVLYPLLTKDVYVKNAQRVLAIVMGLFIGLNVVLSLR